MMTMPSIIEVYPVIVKLAVVMNSHPFIMLRKVMDGIGICGPPYIIYRRQYLSEFRIYAKPLAYQTIWSAESYDDDNTPY